MPTFENERKHYSQERSQFWDVLHQSIRRSAGKYYHRLSTNIYQQLIPTHSTILELGCGDGALLAALNPSRGVGVDFSQSAISQANDQFPHLHFFHEEAQVVQLEPQTFDYIIISELVNDVWDVQSLLINLQQYCNPKTRIILNFYSHLWNLPLQFARKLKLAKPNLPQNWLKVHDMRNLLDISGFEVLRFCVVGKKLSALFPYQSLLHLVIVI